MYTVYLDMREEETDDDPQWILEFAVDWDAFTGVNVSPDDEEGGREGLVLPFPIVKKDLELPPQLARENLNQMVIVYGVINLDGRMEQISVKESPDPRLNQHVVRALEQWAFRPGALEGSPVPVKVLLGIPIWLPEQ